MFYQMRPPNEKSFWLRHRWGLGTEACLEARQILRVFESDACLQIWQSGPNSDFGFTFLFRAYNIFFSGVRWSKGGGRGIRIPSMLGHGFEHRWNAKVGVLFKAYISALGFGIGGLTVKVPRTIFHNFRSWFLIVKFNHKTPDFNSYSLMSPYLLHSFCTYLSVIWIGGLAWSTNAITIFLHHLVSFSTSSFSEGGVSCQQLLKD